MGDKSVKSEDEQDRRIKMHRLRAEAVDPFPHGAIVDRTQIAQIALRGSELAIGGHTEIRCNVAGRLTARRSHGDSSFMDLEDESGVIQLYLRSEMLGVQRYLWVLNLDIGDIVWVEGYLYVTRRRCIVLSVYKCTLLAKSLRPPPARYHGFRDKGSRYRYRELDLMANRRTRGLFRTRAKAVQSTREWMNEHGYTEIESPVLHSSAGGASARPFSTYHNALGRELSLRISTELHLKRCAVGGLERVFEIGKCFRNEGISYRHSPEFTMLEWVCSYSDYTELAHFTEQMIASIAERVLGTTNLEYGGKQFDLARQWHWTTAREAILEAVKIDIMDAPSDQLMDLLRTSGHDMGWAPAVRAVYSKLVEPTLIHPTMVFDFPVDNSVLAKRHPKVPELAEQFDAVIGGIELVTGGTELNDPDEQRDRFMEHMGQGAAAENGLAGQEEGYVRALEYGLPPSAGAGMGVDRLLMILTGNRSLREVVPFPIVREGK